MYEFLKEKIETTSGAFIDNLIFMTNEYCRERMSEGFERFTELSAKSICQILDWKETDDVYLLINNAIEDGELSDLMNRNDRTGFLAECHFPDVSGFKFKEGEEKPFAWSANPGICRLEWIYADTIFEVIEKMQEMSETIFDESVEIFKKNNTLKLK